MKTPRSFLPRSLFSAALGLMALLAQFLAPSAFAAIYYWDGNTNTSGFGSPNAASIWSSAGTAATATNGWSTSSTGIQVGMTSITTLIGDALHFGTDSATFGLGSGTITVSGTVNAASLRFGSITTGNVVLSGGIINLGAVSSIHVGAGSSTVHTISSTITGAGTSLTKTGNTLQLSANNTFTGIITNSTGTLILNNATALGGNNPGVNGSSSIRLGANTTLQQNYIIADAGNVDSFVYAPITLTAAGNNNFLIGAGSSSAPAEAVTFNLNGAIGGTAGANVVFGNTTATRNNADSIIVLGAASTYNGNTTIQAGNTANKITVISGAVNALPTGTVLSFDAVAGSGSGRTTLFDLNGNNQTLAGLNFTGALGNDRNIRVSSTPAATLTINNTANFSFGGSTIETGDPTTTTAQITGAISLVKNGAGTFTLGGTLTSGAAAPGNAFTGDTKILGGILVLGESTSLRNSVFDTAASVAGGVAQGLRTTATALTLGGLAGDKNFASAGGVFTTTTGGYGSVTALTLNLGSGVTRSYSGVIENGAAGMTLTKSGAGTQVLSGINTHSGNTTINAGKLQGVTGGSCASSTVILNAATATNSVSLTDNTKGWTNAAFTAAAAGVLEFNFGVAPFAVAPLQVTGLANFTATPTVRVVEAYGIMAGTYPLMTWGSTSGTAPTTSGLTVSTVTSGKVFSLEVSGNTLNLVVAVESVVKDDNTLDLTNVVSWVGGVVPGSAQKAIWDATVTAANTTVLGADSTWAGIVIANPAGLVTINAGNTLTLGATAIDINMTNATADLTLNCGLALSAANVWDVTNSRTLTVSGAVTGGFGITKQGAGTAILSSGANAYSGATAIREGTVQSGADNALPTSTALTLGSGATVGTLNLATFDQAVATLVVASTNDTAITNLLLIGSGKTLTVSGGLTNGINSTINTTTKLSVSGAGTLSVTGGDLQVGGSVASGVGNAATFDLSGLTNFTYANSAGIFRVGDAVNSSSGGTGSSTLILAATNTITAINFTMNSPTAVPHLIRLGSGINSINANTIEIGVTSQRSGGTLDFNTGTGSLTVRDTAGSGRANMTVGYGSANTSVIATNVVALAGHASDLLLGSLQIAGRVNNSGGASLVGRFSFDAGTLDATSVIVGDRRGTSGNTGAVISSLNLGGGTVTMGSLALAANSSTLAANSVAATNNIYGGTVTITNEATSITLGSATSAAGGGATAVLNLTGGSLTVAGDIVKGSAVGTVTSLLNIDGGTLNLSGKNITGLNNITYTSGLITNLGVVNTGIALAGSGSREFGQDTGVSGTIQGAISGSGVGLTKTGPGTLTLFGTNSYDGATLVSAGKLVVLSTNASTGAVTVSANATLGVTASGTDQWSPASLALADPSTLEINNVQNPGGVIAPIVPTAAVPTVSGVTINISSIAGAAVVGYSYPLLGNQDGTTNGYTLGTQPANITGYLTNSGTTLVYVVTASPDVWLGTDGVNPTWWDVTNSVNWTGGAVNNTPPGTYTNGDFVVFEDVFSPAGPTLTVALQTPVTPSAVTFDNSTKEYIVTASGANVIGSGSLTKSGSGTVTLVGGAHTYSGATTISGGTLQLGDGTTGNDATINNTSGVTNNGALVFNRFGSDSYGGTISGGGRVTKQGAGTQILSGANSYSGGTTNSAGILQADNNTALGTGQLVMDGGTLSNSVASIVLSNRISLAQAATVGVPAATTLTLGGIITNTGALTKEGTGTLTLTGVNTYTGATTNNGGTLQIGATGRLGNGTYAGAISNASGAILEYNGNNSQILSGVISGAGALTKGGTNKIDLTLNNAANTFSGPTTVSNGRISVTAPGHLSSGATTIIQTNGGQLFIQGAGTYSNPMNISTAGYGEAAQNQNVDGAIRIDASSTLSGTITLSGNSRIGNYAPATNTISGPITGGYGLDFYGLNGANSQTHAFVLSNPANDYTGDTVIYNQDYHIAGWTGGSTVLRLGASEVITNGAGKGIVAFTGADGNHVTILELNGFSETLNGVTNVAAAGAIIRNTATGASVLTLGDADTNSAFSGVISDGGVGKTLALTKIGAGTLTLSGANTYIGASTINGGTVQVSGGSAIANAGLVSLADVAGATFQVVGSETIGALTGGGNTGGGVSLDASRGLSLSSGTQIHAGPVSGLGALTNAGAIQTLNGVLSHGGGVSVTSGTLTLGNSNSYTGLTFIGAGANRVIIVTTNSALGATGAGNETTIAGTVGSSGAWLRFSGGVNYTTTEKIIGHGYGDARGFIQGANGSNTFAGDIELSANGNSRIGTQDGAQLTLSGAITQGTGITTADILFRVGSLAGDFVTLANANNSFGGDSAVFTGLAGPGYAGVRLGVANALPTNWTIASLGATATGAGTALDLNGKDQSLNGLITGGSVGLNIINLDTGTPSTLTLNPTANKSQGNTLILGGGGLGVINLVKDGAFTQTLSGANTYTGSTTVSNGILQLTRPGTIASSSVATVHTNGTLLFNSSGGNYTPAIPPISLNGGTLTNFASGNHYTVASIGAVTVTTPSVIGLHQTTAGNGGLYIDGGLQGSAALTVNAGGSAFPVGLALRTTSSTYSGSLTVNGVASAAVGAGSGLVVGSTGIQSPNLTNVCNLPNATITVNGTMAMGRAAGDFSWASGTSDAGLSGTTFQMDALNGTGVVVANFNTASSTRTLSLGNNNGSGTFSGVIAVGVNSTLSLIKNGAGTQTLSGPNTYTGNTVISNGVLELSLAGSIGNSPIIDVQTGAQFVVTNVTGGFTLVTNQTLKGNGTVDGQVNIAAGGILAPGASIGMLTMSANPILGGTVFAEINPANSPNADKLVVSTGTLAYGGALVVTNLGSVPTNGAVFDLFDATIDSGSGFATVNLPSGGALHWNTNNLIVNGTIAFTNNAPTAAAVASTVAQGESVSITNNPGKDPFAADADADPLTFAVVTGPAHGTVSVLANGFTYNNTNTVSNITDTFTYSVADGFGGAATNTMSVNIGSAQGANLVSATALLGKAYLIYAGIPGQSYVSELATNLLPPISWTPVATNTAGVDPGPTPGMIFFTNTIVPPTSFFRTQAQ